MVVGGGVLVVHPTPHRSIQFNHAHPNADEIRQTFLATVGLEDSGVQKSLLNSLNCELLFNDLRDSQKRVRRADFSSAAAVCCGAVKSGWVRSPLESIRLDSRDWTGNEDMKLLKAAVLEKTRKIDKDLGVPMYDLINAQDLDYMTKPHVWCQQLRVYNALLKEHRQNSAVGLRCLLEKSWTSRMLTPRTLWKVEESSDADVRLVLKSGPGVGETDAEDAGDVLLSALVTFCLVGRQPLVTFCLVGRQPLVMFCLVGRHPLVMFCLVGRQTLNPIPEGFRVKCDQPWHHFKHLLVLFLVVTITAAEVLQIYSYPVHSPSLEPPSHSCAIIQGLCSFAPY